MVDFHNFGHVSIYFKTILSLLFFEVSFSVFLKVWEIWETSLAKFRNSYLSINPLNAELNPIRHLLALVGVRHIVHISKIRVKPHIIPLFLPSGMFSIMLSVTFKTNVSKRMQACLTLI